VNAFGSVDVLVSNAGIVHGADFLEVTEADFDRVIRVNLKGVFLVGQAVARQMVEQVEAGGRPGAIVNMSSVNAVFAIANQVPYSASKGGINQLTKVMALSLAPYGIRVNAIGPGSIMTNMLASVNHDHAARNRLLSRTPLGRIGDPSEIAAIAAFLASDDASYITGQTIYADGGRLPLNYTVPVKE
jgi:NAD(P)-dependent dehydrogenase (short-subunit alcohol dehydrogenase family)